MHDGIGGKKIKTEAELFPSKEAIQILIEECKKSSLPFITLLIIDPDAPKKKKLPLKKIMVIIIRCYDKSMNNNSIMNYFSFITFIKRSNIRNL